jgi:hypothetical protein
MFAVRYHVTSQGVTLCSFQELGKGRPSNDITEPSYASEIDTDMGVTGRARHRVRVYGVGTAHGKFRERRSRHGKRSRKIRAVPREAAVRRHFGAYSALILSLDHRGRDPASSTCPRGLRISEHTPLGLISILVIFLIIFLCQRLQ